MGDVFMPLRVVVKKSTAFFVQLKINMSVSFKIDFGLKLISCYTDFLSTLRLHAFLRFSKTARNYLILLVGPLGLESRTNGL